MHRLAPTPSGYLHAGNAANFAVNSLLAGAGPLLLRIDDLDRDRFRPEYLQDVFDVLHWLEIDWTDGPRDAADFHTHWSQEYRMPLYREALTRLRDHPRVFACPCSRRELADGGHTHGCLGHAIDPDRIDVAWRIDTRGTGQHETMPWFAIRKRDGRPSYQLACTVDDLHFGITECARGEDLRASTEAQALLSDLLEYPSLDERITFIHHPLLTEEGQKLSKSQGARSVREWGVSRETIFSIARDWLRGS